MNLLEQFQTIRESAEHGLASALHFEAEGAELVRSFRPNERLILLGGGNIAQPLCRYAADLGFSVIVADDRPTFANRPRFPEAHTVYCDRFENAIDRIGIGAGDYVAVITRGHRYDADCLRKILRGTMPKYLGMIGSKRRTAGLLNLLEGEGFDRAQLDAIHTPIGLDIGALSVKEIAISIVAELIACRRTDTNRGSTPVKSGAFMAVDSSTKFMGTIGGGCSESAVLRQAYYLIGTGESRSVSIDMSNDVAEKEGMVCGGQMKVLLADLSKR